MEVLVIIIVTIVEIVIALILTYFLSKISKRSYKEYLNDYGYAIGVFGLILIVVTIALIRTLFR